MSDVAAAVQPRFTLANITAKPASSFAGVALIATAMGQALPQGGLPTTGIGWALFAVQTAGGILALVA